MDNQINPKTEKANSILLERVEALENKVRKIDEEEINGIKGGTSIRPTLNYLEERVLRLQQTVQSESRVIHLQILDPLLKAVDQLTERLNALEDKQHKISETVEENHIDTDEQNTQQKFQIADLEKSLKILKNRMRG